MCVICQNKKEIKKKYAHRKENHGGTILELKLGAVIVQPLCFEHKTNVMLTY